MADERCVVCGCRLLEPSDQRKCPDCVADLTSSLLARERFHVGLMCVLFLVLGVGAFAAVCSAVVCVCRDPSDGSAWGIGVVCAVACGALFSFARVTDWVYGDLDDQIFLRKVGAKSNGGRKGP